MATPDSARPLTILVFALGLATQLLMETAQLFMGSTREARSTQVPQAVARMRADAIASSFFAISQLPEDEGIPILIDLMKNHRDPNVRKKAAFWLGQKHDPRALNALEEILRR